MDCVVQGEGGRFTWKFQFTVFSFCISGEFSWEPRRQVQLLLGDKQSCGCAPGRLTPPPDPQKLLDPLLPHGGGWPHTVAPTTQPCCLWSPGHRTVAQGHEVQKVE